MAHSTLQLVSGAPSSRSEGGPVISESALCHSEPRQGRDKLREESLFDLPLDEDLRWDQTPVNRPAASASSACWGGAACRYFAEQISSFSREPFAASSARRSSGTMAEPFKPAGTNSTMSIFAGSLPRLTALMFTSPGS